MSAQPEALRLADELEMWTLGEPAAAELRRLHAINSTLMGALGLIAYTDPRDQLLHPHRAAWIARAAIAKATD